MAYVTRDEMIEVFHDTEAFYKSDENLKQAIHDSIKGTKFYSAKNYPLLPEKRFKQTKISVVKRRTLDAAVSMQRRHLELKIAVHNFASATNPGGGVKHGSRAQEESLCRSSTLYPVLNTEENWKRFYTNLHARNYNLQDRRRQTRALAPRQVGLGRRDNDSRAEFARFKLERRRTF